MGPAKATPADNNAMWAAIPISNIFQALDDAEDTENREGPKKTTVSNNNTKGISSPKGVTSEEPSNSEIQNAHGHSESGDAANQWWNNYESVSADPETISIVESSNVGESRNSSIGTSKISLLAVLGYASEPHPFVALQLASGK